MVLEAEKSQGLHSASRKPRKASGTVLVLRLEIWEPAEPGVWSPIQIWFWRQEKTDVLAPRLSGRNSKISLPLPFCSIQDFSGLVGAHPEWRKTTCFLRLPIQIFISSRNTLTDTSRTMFNQIPGHPLAQAKLTITLLYILFPNFVEYLSQCLPLNTWKKIHYLICQLWQPLSPSIKDEEICILITS